MPCIFHWFGNKIHGTYTFWLLWSNFKFWRYLKKASCLFFIYCTDTQSWSRRPAQDYMCTRVATGARQARYPTLGCLCERESQWLGFQLQLPVQSPSLGTIKSQNSCVFPYLPTGMLQGHQKSSRGRKLKPELGIFSGKITSAVNKYGELWSEKNVF